MLHTVRSPRLRLRRRRPVAGAGSLPSPEFGLLPPEVAAGMTRLEDPPLAVRVNLRLFGRSCNLNCCMCPRPAMVDKNAFQAYYDRILGVLVPMLNSSATNRIQTAGAEPLMYPEFRALLEDGRKWPNLRFAIGTNGRLLDEGWADAICAANVAKLAVSLDGATPETHADVRRRSDLERVLRGIRLVAERRRDTQSPAIQVKFIVFRRNMHEMERFVELAHEVGAQETLFQTPLRVIDPRALVAGDPNRETKLEWVHRNEPYRDPHLAAEVLWRLDRAERLARALGVRAQNSNVRGFFVRRHPYLVEAGRAASLDELHAWVDDLVAHRTDLFRPLIPPAVPVEFDPGTVVSWENRDTYRRLAVWFVNRDRRVPGVRAVITRCVDGKEQFDVSRTLADGEYDVFFYAVSDGDYAVSSRGALRVEGSPLAAHEMKNPARAPEKVDPFSLDEYEDVPDRVPAAELISDQDFFCPRPFTNLTIKDGQYEFCSWAQPKYLAMPAGDGDAVSMWNGNPIREARYLMLTGGGREHVCRDICPHFATGAPVRRPTRARETSAGGLERETARVLPTR